MFRLASSKVSALSSGVAKRNQTMQHVSCSLSKIPYVGFSPVRLQTGIQRQPSLSFQELKCKAHMHSFPASLYAATVSNSCLCSPFGQFWYLARPSFLTFQSRGPSLSAGLCCPSRSSLTMASSETLAPSAALSSSLGRPRPTTLSGLGSRASPLYSVCLSLRAAFRTPAFRVAALDCSFTTRSGLRPCPKRLGSRISCRRFSHESANEAAKFALCCGPQSCSPRSDWGFYFRAFTS